MNYLPYFILESPTFKKVYDVGMNNSEVWLDDVDDLFRQSFVRDATWGLDYWEEFLDIESKDGDSLQVRRENILSKLRGLGTLTRENMQSIANSFENGSVEVIENVRNRIPPFIDNKWVLHSNTSITFDYELRLDAVGVGESSYINRIIAGNRLYYFRGNLNEADSYFDLVVKDESGSELQRISVGQGIIGDVVESFTTHKDAYSLDIVCTNLSAGIFIFKDMSLFEGKDLEWRYYYPYKFTLKFVSDFGIPTNLEALKEAVSMVKPSHLDVLYKFRYLLVEEVKVMSINELENQPLSRFAGGVNS